jgi:hypothetical protein
MHANSLMVLSLMDLETTQIIFWGVSLVFSHMGRVVLK